LKTEKVELTFEKGLLSSQEDSKLPPGFVHELSNWEPEPQGGLRCRRGWAWGAPAPSNMIGRRFNGIGSFSIQSGVETPKRVQQKSTIFTGNIAVGSYQRQTIRGNLLIASVAIQARSSAVISAPAGWTLQQRTERQGTDANGTVFTILATFTYEDAPARIADEVFPINGTVDGGYLLLMEVTGVAGAAFDQKASNNGRSTTVSTGTTPTTIQANEYWFAAMAWNLGVKESTLPSNGFVRVRHFTGPEAPLLSAMWSEKAVTATGAASTSLTLPSTQDWVGQVFTFKAKVRTQTGGRVMLAQNRKDATGYHIWAIDREAIDSTEWQLVATQAIGDPGWPVDFTSGVGVVVWTAPTFSNLLRWDAVLASGNIGGSPPGRTVRFHKNRFFVGGTVANPTRLHWSALGSFSDWATANNAGNLEVVQEDGEPIEDLHTFEDTLLIAKRNSLHLLSGSGPQSFDLHQLSSGGGAPGRCICPTPYGAVVAGVDRVWLYEGGFVREISEPIENSYRWSGRWVTTAYLNRTVYICDEGSGIIWAHNFDHGTWWVEEVSRQDEAPACIYTYDDKLLYAPKDAAEVPPLLFRRHPRGDRVRDQQLPETFIAETQQYWFTSIGPITPRHLYLQLRQRGGDSSHTPLRVTPIYDGEAYPTQEVKPRDAPGVYRERVDCAKPAVYGCKFRFELPMEAQFSSLMDIERAELVYDLEEPR
jgi:hypothetical protein